MRAVVTRLNTLLSPLVAQKGKKRIPSAVNLGRDLQALDEVWTEQILPGILAKLDLISEADERVLPVDLAGDLLDVSNHVVFPGH